MDMKEFEIKCHETALRIVSPKAQGSAYLWVTNKSLYHLVAEMILRCHWDPSDFMFLIDEEVSETALTFVVKGQKSVLLSGYNFAWQVRQICRAIEDAGYFE